MKKTNPKILTDFLDTMVASGQTNITAKDLIKQTGISQHNISCVFNNLRKCSKYRIEPEILPGNKLSYQIGMAHKITQLTATVVKSTDIINAWRNIARNPEQRVYIPAFWPV